MIEDREEDGRGIAEAVELPGVMRYGLGGYRRVTEDLPEGAR
jgi:hypothetical protein